MVVVLRCCYEISNQSLSLWRNRKKSKSIGKRLVAVFFTKDGILSTVSLDKSKTITAKWYTETFLPKLFGNFIFHVPLDFWFLHHDNPPAHQAFATQEFLEGMGVQILEHPANSSYLAPCDFSLFPYVKQTNKWGRNGLMSGFVVWKSVLTVTESTSKYFVKWSMHDKNYGTAYVY